MHCSRRVSPHPSSTVCGQPLVAGFCPRCQPEALAQDSSVSTQRLLAPARGDWEMLDDVVA